MSSSARSHSTRWTSALIVAAFGCGETDPLPATGELRTEAFASDIVGDDYVLRLRIPPDYDEQMPYPLVVQLDPTFAGGRQFDTTVGLVSQQAAEGLWPEAIVLGVDYPDPATRDRDYLPPQPLNPEFSGDGADRFYAALRDEILPYVESRYSVEPAARTLVGYSNGGVFAWYTAFRHDPAVGPLFSGIVAGDNGYDESLFTLERWHAERSDALPIRLFTTRAIYNGAVQSVTLGFMEQRLQQRNYRGLDFDTAVFEADHGGAIAASFEAGLEHVLGGNR